MPCTKYQMWCLNNSRCVVRFKKSHPLMTRQQHLQPKRVVLDRERDKELHGDKDGRKQWEEGEGAPVVELLKHKQLQTATYAIDDGNTGMYTWMSQF